MLVIPAIDLIEGQCVRLTQGDYGQKTVYGLDPVEVARGFEKDGATWIHIVDLDGAKEGSPVNLSVVEEISAKTDLRIQFGGGLRSDEAVRRSIRAGAERAIVGTRIAEDLREAAKWFKEFGDSLIASVDTKDGFVAVHGWQETQSVKGVELALQLQEIGCRRVLTTDIATDGMLAGPNLASMREFVESLEIPVIASGGVSDVDDLRKLREIGCESAIVGKALYEGRFGLVESLQEMANHFR